MIANDYPPKINSLRYPYNILYKIPVKSYAIMFSNDRHSPNRDFVFPILFDDTGNWQCIYMGYAWYVFS